MPLEVAKGEIAFEDVSFTYDEGKKALQHIHFTVKPGQKVALVGLNGSGKSTLLKILSRVTAPTTGSIKFGGRVASLLEVGTGFNGEMTGRENIYLNGAILGMTKKEITQLSYEIIGLIAAHSTDEEKVTGKATSFPRRELAREQALRLWETFDKK